MTDPVLAAPRSMGIPIDPILVALLTDPDPTTRLIAADYLDEAGREIEALWWRLRATGWPSSPNGVDRAHEGGYRIHLIAFAGDQGWIACSLGTGRPWYYFWPQRAGVNTASGWTDAHGKRNKRQFITPPPGLEAAVLAVLRRRLAEVCGA
jgi:uncharacterized protein (TIGR02996 family)